MKILFNVLTVISGVLVVISVLVQNRGQSLGASFGGDSGFYRSKRGAEKVLFNATIVFAVIFVLAIILSILSKN
jgi:preprotein translocase subunit SecG